MTYASVAVTLAALVATPFVDRLSGMTVFIGFLLLIQLQGLFAHRARKAVSPIDAAVSAWRSGDRGRAETLFAKAFTRPTPLFEGPGVGNLSSPELGALVVNLPQPFPRGNPANEYLLTMLLIRFGRAREAADYAAEGFARSPSPMPACGVARAAAHLGDGATAAAWLRTATDHGLPPDQLTTLVDSPEFARVRGHPAIQQLAGPTASPSATPRLT
jgi:hypothetical protein